MLNEMNKIMKNKFSALSKTQKDILKNRILKDPCKYFGFSFNALYGDMDIIKYSEEEIKSALNELVTENYLTINADDTYIFSRKQFIKAREFFINDVRINKAKNATVKFIKYMWKHFTITIVIAILTAYITTVITNHINKPKVENSKTINIKK